jgi:HSP20 family molecular chaperone IbpA
LVSNTAPVVNADVKVVGKDIETKTDEKGEFVLYFKGIKKEDIKIEIKKDGETKKISATIEEGKTKSLGRISFS